ncbi:MAG: hypothetical protein WCC00_12085 [Candidatus Aminicenantales bacterium]
MIIRLAVPFLILTVLFLPLPFVLSGFIFAVLLAIRPRGEPCPDPAVMARISGPRLLRGPPR